MADPNLIRFRHLVAGATEHLESRRQEVNDLNVFPVADGDTGDNMVLTMRAVLEELDRLAAADGDRTIDEIGRDEIVESVARAALLGARGNSGVILSQLVHGAAEELFSRPGELIDATLIGAALARAAERAYASVREPAEGTILTVVREMASRVARELAHMPEPRLARDDDPDAAGRRDRGMLERAVDAGEAAVMRTPDLLAVLRDAGVVDAGGYGARRDLRRHRRRAARRRAAGAAPPHAGARHPPAARLGDVPLLHELRRHRRRAWTRRGSRPRSTRSATRCSSSATPAR